MRIYINTEDIMNMEYTKGGDLLNDTIYDEMVALAKEKLLTTREYDFMVNQMKNLNKYKGGNYQLMRIDIETKIQAICKRLNEIKRQMLNLIINNENFVAMVDLDVYHNEIDDPDYSAFVNELVVEEEEDLVVEEEEL